MDFATAECGPKMQACSERERLFVWHYLMLGGTYGLASEAARQAGFVDNDNGSIRVTAHRLLQRDRVLDALDEVGRKAFRSLLIPAVAAAAKLIENAKHPDHARTTLSTLSRLGLVEKSSVDLNVTGEVVLSHTEEAVAQLRALRELGVPRAKLIELFGYSGLTRYETLLLEASTKASVSRETIEGEAVDVTPAAK
jgi:hypothetical protein